MAPRTSESSYVLVGSPSSSDSPLQEDVSSPDRVGGLATEAGHVRGAPTTNLPPAGSARSPQPLEINASGIGGVLEQLVEGAGRAASPGEDFFQALADGGAAAPGSGGQYGPLRVLTAAETTVDVPIIPPANPEFADIATVLNNSKFGTFVRAMSVVDASVKDVFKLPKIIVIGDESAGKSSLLESITKCPVFPRHRELCTKMPIRLRLTHVAPGEQAKIVVTCEGQPPKELASRDDILSTVNGMMDAETAYLGGSGLISAKEIVISISDTDVPTFECVDLPGIRRWPEKVKEQIEKLINTYLSRKCIALCVIDGTTARLSTVAALDLVNKARRNRDTILVLTKADTVASENVKSYIVDRILGTSTELHGMTPFASCFAVVNRSTSREVSLDIATASEKAHFERVIFNDPYLFDDLAPNGDRRRVELQIRERITIPNLLKRLDSQFNEYIVHYWKPDALATLDREIGTVENKVRDLGVPVEELTLPGVLFDLKRLINMRGVCSAIRKVDIIVPLEHTAAPLKLELKKLAGVVLSLQNKSDQIWGSLAWARFSETLMEDVFRACRAAAEDGQDTYLNLIRSAVDAAFDARDTASRINVGRFATLRGLLRAEVVPTLHRAAMKKVQEFVKRAVTSLVDASYGEPATSAETFQKLQQSFTGCVMRQLVDLACTKLPLGTGISEGFRLEEDEGHVRSRSELNQLLTKLREAKATVEGLEI